MASYATFPADQAERAWKFWRDACMDDLVMEGIHMKSLVGRVRPLVSNTPSHWQQPRRPVPSRPADPHVRHRRVPGLYARHPPDRFRHRRSGDRARSHHPTGRDRRISSPRHPPARRTEHHTVERALRPCVVCTGSQQQDDWRHSVPDLPLMAKSRLAASVLIFLRANRSALSSM